MTVQYTDLAYMWQTVILPRVGDIYVFGGSLSPSAVNQGTDCTGACSEVNEALLYGPAMNWQRQFWTGTFEGAVPGNIGPFGGADITTSWVCINSPDSAPPDAAMIVAVLQDPDPSSAHMVCCAPDPANLTGFRAGKSDLVAIESGGSFTDANGNSILHIGPTATSVWSSMFNQWFYLPGPIVGGPGSAGLDLSSAPGITALPTLNAISAQLLG